MNYTAHSEYGKIKSMFIKNPTNAFLDDKHINDHWKQLNFLEKPDFEKSIDEFKEFESILKNQSDELCYLPSDISVNMDSIYCRDASISTNKGMILCNMGKAERKNEPIAQKNAFIHNGIQILGSIQNPGTVEGGDVAWLNEQTLAVGLSYRTNEEGIRQLKNLLDPLNVQIITVPLPHYKGQGDVFHLMSIFSPVDKDLAVIYSPLMPIVFRNFLLESGYQFVEVTDEEFESMACNVLAIAPRECIIVSSNPKTKEALTHAGCKVYEYRGTEISIKGGGGPTCLTRPILRYV